MNRSGALRVGSGGRIGRIERDNEVRGFLQPDQTPQGVWSPIARCAHTFAPSIEVGWVISPLGGGAVVSIIESTWPVHGQFRDQLTGQLRGR